MAVLLVSVLLALLIYPVSAANPTINLRYNSPVSRLINYRLTSLFYNNTSCVKPCLFGVDMYRVATNVLKLDVFGSSIQELQMKRKIRLTVLIVN